MVGYMNAPFAERTILHGGAQSMPLEYNNVKTPHYSQAERSWDTPQNWTVNGADTLSLYFRGYPTAFLENADGSITMGAGGADIWGNADQFRFAYKQLSGDGSIIARVDSMVAANAWTKVGVTIRENLEAGSRHAMVAVTPSNGVTFLNRATTDGASTQINQTGLAAPYWVKLTRTGNDPGALYLTLEDKSGHKKTVTHSNPQAVTAVDWQQWKIPLSQFSSGGVNVSAIKTMILGVDNRSNPASGGAGLLFIDDIAFGKPAAGQ